MYSARIFHRRFATAPKPRWSEYQRLTLLEQIMQRPDTYIGSTRAERAARWVLDPALGRVVWREATWIPGLLKIFDEILVNATDNKRRDARTSHIHVDLDLSDPRNPSISIMNDGRGLPVQIHETEQVHVPEMVFGSLLTGSNFDDSSGGGGGGQGRGRDGIGGGAGGAGGRGDGGDASGGEVAFTGGRNGYGAKLCNIFSREFTVETVDTREGLRFTKTWHDNMSGGSEAVVEPLDPPVKGSAKGVAGEGTGGTGDYTRVTFVPDLSKFGVERLDEDMLALMRKRVWDIAACEGDGLEVFMDGERVPIQGFEDYVRHFVTEGEAEKIREAMKKGGEKRKKRKKGTKGGKKGGKGADGASGESGVMVGVGADLEPRGVGHDAVWGKVGKHWELAVIPHKGLGDESIINGMHMARGGTHIKVREENALRVVSCCALLSYAVLCCSC